MQKNKVETKMADQVVTFTMSGDACLVLIGYVDKILKDMRIDDPDRTFLGEFLSYLESAYQFQATTMANHV